MAEGSALNTWGASSPGPHRPVHVRVCGCTLEIAGAYVRCRESRIFCQVESESGPRYRVRLLLLPLALRARSTVGSLTRNPSAAFAVPPSRVRGSSTEARARKPPGVLHPAGDDLPGEVLGPFGAQLRLGLGAAGPFARVDGELTPFGTRAGRLCTGYRALRVEGRSVCDRPSATSYGSGVTAESDRRADRASALGGQQTPSSCHTPHWPVVPGFSLVVHHLAFHLRPSCATTVPPV